MPINNVLTNSGIEAAYRARTGGSARLVEAARETFPSGIVHDARKFDPYPIYVSRAKGAHKWDVDGNEYIDYVGGHGSLILGHGRAEVVEAVASQLALGTHFGACHELEIQWGELVKRLVPCAERVRFHSSGTEANLMALRLARAWTGRPKVVRFKGHFHGWHDHVASAYDSHFDGSPTPGVVEGVAENVIVAPPDDIEATEALLRSRDDIAVVMLEPTGGTFGVLPLGRDFVARLREITTELGILLHFDEVVTGFRVAPGGAQAHYGITPDLASFAKILAGGLPGGAIAGRREILDMLDFEAAAREGFEKVGHQGTYNANPVSAVAGITALELVESTGACERATEQAEKLRKQLNEVFAEEEVAWAAYGEHSGVYLYTNPDSVDLNPRDFDASTLSFDALRRGGKHPAMHRFRLALLTHGVDITGKPGGTVSAVHSDDDVEQTAEATRATIRMLRNEGELQS